MSKPESRSNKLLLALAKHNLTAAGARVRQFDLTDGFHQFVGTEVKASKPMPYDTANADATVRREWLENNNGVFVRVYDDGLIARRAIYKPNRATGWRPELAVRSRLLSVAPHLDFSVGYLPAETNGTQFRTVSALNWENGAPDDFEGADAVYLYRIAPKSKKK